MRQFTEAYGLEKSAVSEPLVEASRAKLKQLMKRQLDRMEFCALLMDATPFKGQQEMRPQRECWVGSSPVIAEKQFRRVKGHKLIPQTASSVEMLTPAKIAVVKNKRKAS